MQPTMRRTSGNTRNKAGIDTIQEINQALGHAKKNTALKPSALSVATAETIADIKMESTTGVMIDA